MKNKQAKKALVLSVALFMVMVLGATSVLASSVGGGSSVGSGGSGGSSVTPPVTAPGGLEITGYTLDPNYDKITKGMVFGIRLEITDKREEVQEYMKSVSNSHPPEMRVNVRENTASFTVPGDADRSFDLWTPSVPQNSGWFVYDIYLPLTYTGVGNTLQCDIYYSLDGKTMSIPIYPLTLTLNQCVEYQEPVSSTPESSGVTVKGTGFVLKSISYGEGNLNAGERFTLNAELLSTNGTTKVENVTVGLTPPKEISLAEGSSLLYVGTVKPNQTIPVQFVLVPGANTENGSYTITIDVKGINSKDGTEVSAQMSVTVPVVQPERFEIFNTQLPSNLVANMDGEYSSITLVNEGKGSVSNVSVEIVGEGLSTEEGKQYLGHIGGGEQKSADFYITASMAGQIDAQVLVTYESAQGEKKTLTFDFSVMVEDMGDFGDGGMDPSFPIEPMPEENAGFPMWGWALIILAVVGGGVAALVVIRKKRKAKRAAEELEELGEDDDEDI